MFNQFEDLKKQQKKKKKREKKQEGSKDETSVGQVEQVKDGSSNVMEIKDPVEISKQVSVDVGADGDLETQLVDGKVGNEQRGDGSYVSEGEGELKGDGLAGGDGLVDADDKGASRVDELVDGDRNHTSDGKADDKGESTEDELIQKVKSKVDKGEQGQSNVKSTVSNSDNSLSFFKIRIAELENENLTLKNEVKRLTSKLKALELENATFIASGGDHGSDVSLSPSPSLSKYSHPRRKHSFEDVDLYGEAGKISDIRQQMEQWSGWQVDMRSWRLVKANPAFEI